jgi:hypothetical protein
MHGQGHGDRFRELEDAYAGYTVYDEHYERIGRVDDLFVDGEGREQYIGVKMGLFGMKSTLIPMDVVRVNDLRQLVEVAAPREIIEGAPTFDDDEEISAEYERLVHAYFGDHRTETLPNASDYFGHHTHDGPVDTEFGERAERPPHQPPAAPEPAGPPAARDAPPASAPFPADPLSEDPSEDPPVQAERPPEERSDERVRVRRLPRA